MRTFPGQQLALQNRQGAGSSLHKGGRQDGLNKGLAVTSKAHIFGTYSRGKKEGGVSVELTLATPQSCS